jgi:hypothetical protein
MLGVTAGGFSWIAAKMEYIRVQVQIIVASDTVAMTSVNMSLLYTKQSTSVSVSVTSTEEGNGSTA